MATVTTQAPLLLEKQAPQIQLEMFEGPLDLLLHLIRQQEIDIYDIPIATVTEQYLEFLDMMRDLNINLAGEFLVMAATLILIKSKMLLPPDPNEADPEGEFDDPRAELVVQLLEYEKFKNAAHLLYDRETVELCVWPRGEAEFEEDEKEMVDANLFDLVKAFHRIVERHKEQIVLEVEQDTVTLEQKLAELRALLSLEKEVFFSRFLQSRITKLQVVFTLFALLEMVREREVRLFQKGIFADIRIVAC